LDGNRTPTVSASFPNVRSPLRKAIALGVFLLDSLLRAISPGMSGYTNLEHLKIYW